MGYSENKYKILFEKSVDAILILQGTRFIEVNQSTLKMFNVATYEDFLNAHPSDFSPELQPDGEKSFIKAEKMIKTAMDNGVHLFEWVHKKKTGETFLAEISLTLVGYQNDEPLIHSIVRDLSDRKVVEDKLKISKENYKLLLDLAPTAFFHGDPKGNFIAINKKASEITGYSEEELLSMNMQQLFSKDVLNEKPLRYDLLKDGKTVVTERMIQRKNNQKLHIEMSSKMMPDNTLQAFFIDITDRIKNEKALRENEEKYRRITELTSDYIFSVDITEDGRNDLRWVAGSFEEITGYNLQEYLDAGGWTNHIHPDDIEYEKREYQKIINNEKVEFEIRTIRKDGSTCWVRSMGVPVWDEKLNKPIGIIGAVKDITKEKRDEAFQKIQYNIAKAVVSSRSIKELFLSVEQELNPIINTKNFYIALYNKETDSFSSEVLIDEMDKFTSWEAKKSLSGYLLRQKRKLKLSKRKILHLVRNKEINLIGTLPEVWLGVPLVTPENSFGVMVAQDYENFDAIDGSIVEIFEVIGNQLSLYLDKMQTEENANKLSKAVIQSPIGVMITDHKGKIQYVNPNYCKMTGYPESELLNNYPNILKSGFQDKEFYSGLWKKIKSGKDWYGEFQNKSKDGTIYWESGIISPIFDENGKITNFLAIKEDITEKKHMLEELILSKDKAEASEKIKTEFLAQMSHEIRSPLNVILNFMSLIKDEIQDKVSEDLIFGFSSIDSASKRIIRTIDQILNMSDLQLGTYDLIIKPVNLKTDILDKLLKEYSYLIEEKKLGCIFDVNCDSCIVPVDEYSINQVFANLIDNAIKYTHEGNIEFLIGRDEKDQLYVKICDTGIGINEEYLPNIFDPFLQEEQGYSREYEGNGLGLSLVKKYCELNNSTIEVESKKGIGTCFIVTFNN